MAFKLATADPITKLILSVWAREKVGKTHLALTFPEPIWIFNWDQGLDELLPKFAGKNIQRADYHVGPLATDDDYRAIWTAFLQDLNYLGRNQVPGGSVVLDTGTHLWQMIQKVDLAEIKAKRKSGEVFPFDYANANTHLASVVNYLKQLDMNLVLLHRARAVYDGSGNKTERIEAQENSQIPYLVQSVIRLYVKPTKEGSVRVALVESSRTCPEMNGHEIEDPDYDKLVGTLLV